MWANPSYFTSTSPGVCVGCDVQWGKRLEFVSIEDECPICMHGPADGVATGVVHSCGRHAFCVQCFSTMYGTAPSPEPSPYDFGCPEPPDEDYSEQAGAVRVHEWSRAHPHEAATYFAAQQQHERELSLMLHDDKCPICRTRTEPEWQVRMRQREGSSGEVRGTVKDALAVEDLIPST
jgi:hypothetical protein